MNIATRVLEAIERQAASAAPHECCGLLLGTADVVLDFVATRNASAEPLCRFEIPPAEHFAAIRRSRAAGIEVIGAYHSHPRSAPVPSSTDLAEAFEEFLFVIAGRPAERWEIRAWRLSSGNFVEVALVPSA